MVPRHARALQAYYDGDELLIHKTELSYFTKGKNTDALVLHTMGGVFCSWGHSIGGETDGEMNEQWTASSFSDVLGSHWPGSEFWD